ncbi:MAG: hypothetical protein HYZ27_09780, partial [Deltaproteobacteria bacterium]|nr:hypothetical protein [Deltaproteobacteria bacterium]
MKTRLAAWLTVLAAQPVWAQVRVGLELGLKVGGSGTEEVGFAGESQEVDYDDRSGMTLGGRVMSRVGEQARLGLRVVYMPSVAFEHDVPGAEKWELGSELDLRGRAEMML